MQIVEKRDDLTFYLAIAAVFHVIIIAFFFSLGQLINFNRTPIKLNNKIDIVKASVRVDVVAMPKLTLEEMKKIDLTPKEEVEPILEKPVEVNETSKVEFKKKRKKLDLSKSLAQYADKKVKVKKNKVKKTKRKLSADLKKIILEGNKLSAGSAATGDNNKQADNIFVGYVQTIPDVVRPYWKLPSYLLEKDLRCRLRIFLSANGKLLKTEIFESSGVLEFDNKAIDAVKKSSPFPRPPKEAQSRVVRGDLILGFPL